MNKFRITLTFDFQVNDSEDWIEKQAKRQKQEAFDRTDQFYAEHDIIKYIKTFRARDMISDLLCDEKILSAEWDAHTFQIHALVETETTRQNLLEDLENNSLEDGIYEGYGECGWMIYTRGPNNEICDGKWEHVHQFWLYGLTDYRNHPVVIEDVA